MFLDPFFSPTRPGADVQIWKCLLRQNTQSPGTRRCAHTIHNTSDNQPRQQKKTPHNAAEKKHTFRRSDGSFHLPELWGGSWPISQHTLLVISCSVYSVFSLRSSAVLWVRITLKDPTEGDVSKGNVFVFFFEHARMSLLHADLHNPILTMFNVACDHLSSSARDFFSS